jgi:hypothetical protein
LVEEQFSGIKIHEIIKQIESLKSHRQLITKNSCDSIDSLLQERIEDVDHTWRVLEKILIAKKYLVIDTKTDELIISKNMTLDEYGLELYNRVRTDVMYIVSELRKKSKKYIC